ncbi:MAG: tetratricopeptide repeat protein, partial [Thermodesulfovibrionales bacterium]
QRDIVDRVNEAKRLYQQDKIYEAKKIVITILQKEPTNIEAKNLAEQISHFKEKKRQAGQLVNEGYVFEQHKRYNEAIQRYQQAIAILPNPELQQRITILQNIIKEQAQCEGKWQEGVALYNQKRPKEALVKFKENLACNPSNRERQDYVARLENSIRQQEADRQVCMDKRRQGDSLVQQKRIREAIVQYREHLRCNPDGQLEGYVKTLENIVRREEEQRQRVEYGKRLRAEGEALQRANRLQEAIAKYRESLRYLPDPDLERHIRELELAMVRPTPTPQPTPQSTYRPPVVTAPPISSVNLSGLWIGKCEGYNNTFNVEIKHSGNTFTAKSDSLFYDENSGTITGNQIRGKSTNDADIVGVIINKNLLKVTISDYKCELQRANGRSPAQENSYSKDPIAGEWNSNWGRVTFKAGNPITGSWDQGGGRIGQFSKGTYDPATRILRIYYFQPWNNAIGWQKFRLSEDGKRLDGKPDHEGGWDWTCTR